MRKTMSAQLFGQQTGPGPAMRLSPLLKNSISMLCLDCSGSYLKLGAGRRLGRRTGRRVRK